MPLRGCPELVCVVESSDSSTIIIIIMQEAVDTSGGKCPYAVALSSYA